MLIVPVVNKSSKKHIPWLTLVLIVINALIYFGLQSGESDARRQAMRYYVDSGLLEQELAAYKEQYPGRQHSAASSESKEQQEQRIAKQMLADQSFQKQLRKNEVITRQHSEFQAWSDKRQRFEQKMMRVVSYKYGYSPFRDNRSGLLSYMFLHGSTMHLVGNMVFLWLVGSVLELALGGGLFACVYLVTGVCSGVLFGVVYPDALGPLIGASGAVSGLMGAYTLLFWARRVRVFYSLGFYFDYAKVPALLLLPVWLGNEFFQLYTNTGSRVAYMAHVGGLLSGALCAFGIRAVKGDIVERLFAEDERRDQVTELLESGLRKFAELDLAGARGDIQRLLVLEPDNRLAMRHLFNIEKASPRSELFHDSARQLLVALQEKDATAFLEVFEEYNRLSGQPRLTADLLITLCEVYLSQNNCSRAAGCLKTLLRVAPQHNVVPALLLKLAQAYTAFGKHRQSLQCHQLLVKKYGTSHEGTIAQQILMTSAGVKN